jgi:hypothetical protein
MRDLLNLRILLKHRDVEIGRLFRLIIEPQHWSNSLHLSYCALRNAMQRCDAAVALKVASCELSTASLQPDWRIALAIEMVLAFSG